MVRIIYIETSTKTCSVGWSENGLLKAESTVTSEQYRHSEMLHTTIDRLLKEGQLKLSDFHAVCVSAGPGSYTGLRIGVSTAKGFAYGANLKLLSNTSLHSLAAVACKLFPGYDYYIPMLDARRMEVFTQVFNSEVKEQSEIEAKILDEQSFSTYLERGKCLFVGDGAPKFKDVIHHSNAIFEYVEPSIKGMVQQAHLDFQHQHWEDVAYFEPFYLKDFVAGR